MRIKLQGSEPGAAAALAALPWSCRPIRACATTLALAATAGRRGGARALLLDLPSPLPRPELWWPAQQAANRDALDAGDSRLAYRLAAESRQTAGVAMVESARLAGRLALRFNDEPAPAGRSLRANLRAATTPSAAPKAPTGWDGRKRRARPGPATAGAGGCACRRLAADLLRPACGRGDRRAAELRDQLLPPRAASDAARAALLRRPVAQAALLLCGAGCRRPGAAPVSPSRS
ncbi:MAG: hypothetical protein U1E17_06275 [Geminicoccaceae bacterium]